MVMLDTNICIFLIREKSEKALAEYRKHELGDVVISIITLSELEYGVRNSAAPEKSAAALTGFLVGVDVLDYDAAAAHEYGKVRANLKQKRITIGPLDMLIAAHAKAAGCALITNNTREFERVEGLVLADWSR
ncbi:MAG: type II toxin-antitoxin system VapC family toxin [Clostridiales Family XIII bacterium]|jgi:tRNA(fMet)-specific endonuclease VapC|nr:type II toxin-antitoxin system VapC family toxin [Clostridiales Family XIII bacterium]